MELHQVREVLRCELWIAFRLHSLVHSTQTDLSEVCVLSQTEPDAVQQTAHFPPTGVLHTIMFNRSLGPVKPQDVDSELFDITYVSVWHTYSLTHLPTGGCQQDAQHANSSMFVSLPSPYLGCMDELHNHPEAAAAAAQAQPRLGTNRCSVCSLWLTTYMYAMPPVTPSCPVGALW